MSDRCPKERVNLDGLDDQAGNGGPKMRSTKVPTKSNSASQSRPNNKDVSSGDDVSLAGRDEVVSTGTDNKLDDEAAGATLMTRLTGAAAEGRRLCRSLFVGRNPQDVPGYAGGTAGLLPGGATNAGSSASARRLMGGSQRPPPALMATSDESYREESNRCKEAGGVQDNLSDEEEDNKDIDKEKDDDRDEEASNAELITASAKEGLNNNQCRTSWRERRCNWTDAGGAPMAMTPVYQK
jgi:hypothetical protein